MIVSTLVTLDGRRAAGCEYYGVCRAFATISNTCSRFERETIRNNSTRWMFGGQITDGCTDEERKNVRYARIVDAHIPEIK
jgi:hypothetical protein